MNIKQRNLVTAIILSFVTCGIYAIIWAFSAAKEAVSVKEPEGGTLEGILAIIIPFIGLFLAEKKFAEGCAEKGIEHKDNSIIYLVLGIFGLSIVSLAMMQNDLNKLAAE